MTTIRYSVATGQNGFPVFLSVFNLLGQNVKTLVNEKVEPGVHSVVWDGTDDRGQVVPSGVYFLCLESGRSRQTTRMVLLK